MPQAGGLHDQPAYLILGMEMIANVYEMCRSRFLARDKVQWSIDNKEAANFCVELDLMRQDND